MIELDLDPSKKDQLGNRWLHCEGSPELACSAVAKRGIRNGRQ
jgi:hypothetical protein